MKFRFEAKSAKELQAEKKDKIQIFYKKDQNWYFAENANGSQGIVPISYVDVSLLMYLTVTDVVIYRFYH